jgi:hypothetical protein
MPEEKQSNKMPKEPLSRSSIESSIAFIITIRLVFPMTWELRIGLLIILSVIVGDLINRSPLTIRLHWLPKIILFLIGAMIFVVPVRDQWMKDHPIPLVTHQEQSKTEQQKPHLIGGDTIIPGIDKKPTTIKKEELIKPMVTAFDSRNRIVIYNPDVHKIFISYLSVRSEGFDCSEMFPIDKNIEGKGFIVKDIIRADETLSDWRTREFTEDTWNKLLKLRLRDTKCVRWHIFIPTDPAYKTVKNFFGSGFRTVPIDATLHYYSEQNGREFSLNFEALAVPFLHRDCELPNGTFKVNEQ